MTDSGALVCSIHLDQAARGRCRQCGKAFCGSCQVEDIASEESFCSGDCRGIWLGRQAGGTVSNQHLLDAYAKPIRSGWKLWIRSLPALSFHSVPLAVLMTAALESPMFNVLDQAGEVHLSPAGMFVWFAMAGIGIAMTQVVLTEKHTGLVRGNPYLWVLKRFVPWLLTILLGAPVIIAGYLALILPGIYLAIRLFWADEFALVHGSGPIRSLRDSWELTRDKAGNIFAFQFLAGLASYVILLPFFLSFAVAIPMARGSLGAAVFFFIFFFWGMLTVYAGLHAPEVVYFYGLRARQATTLAESPKTLGI